LYIFLVAILQGMEGVAWPGSRGLASKLTKPEQQSKLIANIIHHLIIGFFNNKVKIA